MGTVLDSLLRRLTCFKVETWGSNSDNDMDPGLDREVAEFEEADVVSSLYREKMPVYDLDKQNVHEVVAGLVEPDHYVNQHAVVLDIDWPAQLVESSTPGHHHLYIDVPGGIPEDRYFALLDALADAGVIEQGYAEVSKKRGHTDVRLPWVKKEVL